MRRMRPEAVDYAEMTAPNLLDLEQHGRIRLGYADKPILADMALTIEEHGHSVEGHWWDIWCDLHGSIISSVALPVKSRVQWPYIQREQYLPCINGFSWIARAVAGGSFRMIQ